VFLPQITKIALNVFLLRAVYLLMKNIIHLTIHSWNAYQKQRNRSSYGWHESELTTLFKSFEEVNPENHSTLISLINRWSQKKSWNACGYESIIRSFKDIPKNYYALIIQAIDTWRYKKSWGSAHDHATVVKSLGKIPLNETREVIQFINSFNFRQDWQSTSYASILRSTESLPNGQRLPICVKLRN
jgi:hypothetical protein